TRTASWSSAANWSHSNVAAAGLVPNNGNGGFQFNAVIPNGVPIQDVPNLTLNNLIFNNGTINGSSSISLTQGGTWTGGGYNVSASLFNGASATFNIGGTTLKQITGGGALVNSGTVTYGSSGD